MKIIIKSYDKEVSWSNDTKNKIIDETKLDEIFDSLKGLLICLGYHSDCIDEEILQQSYMIQETMNKKE